MPLLESCDEKTLKYAIKWSFDNKELHEMNAKTLNLSEKAFIDYLELLAKEANFKIEIKNIARLEGSFIDNFVIIANSPVVQILIGAAVAKFFSPNPKPKTSDLANTELAIDIQQKLNDGMLTQKQAEAYIDTLPTKTKNAFYKANKSDVKIKELLVKENQQTIAKISSSEFDNYIFDQVEFENIRHNAQIYIISPVYVKGTQEAWSGEFEKEQIKFRVKDKEFLEKVYSRVIEIPKGTFLDVELKDQTFMLDGKEKHKWIVEQVNSYGLDINHQYEVAHKEEVNPNQIELF